MSEASGPSAELETIQQLQLFAQALCNALERLVSVGQILRQQMASLARRLFGATSYA